jgi:hypothetical protein
MNEYFHGYKLFTIYILVLSGIHEEIMNRSNWKNAYLISFLPSTSIRFFVLLFCFLVSLGGVRLSPLGTSATVGLLYQPRMIDDDDDYGAVGGMRIGRVNRSTRRKPAPMPLCPPQIPHDLGSNPGRRSRKPATNRLSYGTAENLLLKVFPVSYGTRRFIIVLARSNHWIIFIPYSDILLVQGQF